MSQENNQQLQVKVSDETLKGIYANMVQIAHTGEEFVLDFMNIFPPAGVLSARIFVSPAHMKRMIAALQENLKRYEEQYGKVEASPEPDHKYGFRTE
jgi:hypothetical protein